MFTKGIVTVSVINDLVTDNRVLRTAEVLNACGYHVRLVGRVLPGSLSLPQWKHDAVRMKLLFRSGPLFYLFFNLRLFFVLWKSRSALLYANDLDTLLPNYLVSRFRKIPLVYDSHELFCEVPELLQTPVKRRIWQWLEKKIVPKLSHCITVNESIAAIMQERYKVPFHVIRNITANTEVFSPKSRQELDLPADKKILLLQGAGINIDRGAEELVEAMAFVEDTLLLIIGSGDVWDVLKRKIGEMNLGDRVRLISRIPKEELRHYTANADFGVSIDKNTNLNYYYSLPNKIFDYIHAGLPVLASRLPEIERIVAGYDIGVFIASHDPAHIATAIREIMLPVNQQRFRNNCLKAAHDLNWQNESHKLAEIIRAIDIKS